MKKVVIVFVLLMVVACFCTAQNINNLDPIFRAIQRGDQGAVESYLARGVDINCVDSLMLGPTEQELSPLSAAIMFKQYDLARFLISRGADINQTLTGVNLSNGSSHSNSVLSVIATNLKGGDSNTQSFANYFLSLNPFISPADVGFFAQTGMPRYVLQTFNKLQNNQWAKGEAVINIITTTIMTAGIDGGGVFTNSQVEIIRFAVEQNKKVEYNYFDNNKKNELLYILQEHFRQNKLREDVWNLISSIQVEY